jgi:hypothetical protein
MQEDLNGEAERATELLKGKVIDKVWRHREAEIGIEFIDGARLFIDRTPSGLEISITGEDSQPTSESK